MQVTTFTARGGCGQRVSPSVALRRVSDAWQPTHRCPWLRPASPSHTTTRRPSSPATGSPPSGRFSPYGCPFLPHIPRGGLCSLNSGPAACGCAQGCSLGSAGKPPDTRWAGPGLTTGACGLVRPIPTAVLPVTPLALRDALPVATLEGLVRTAWEAQSAQQGSKPLLRAGARQPPVGTHCTPARRCCPRSRSRCHRPSSGACRACSCR